ncbi:MAG: choice-of-anchor Q domain-containing protein, partial [Pseudomonadota bacterium]
MATFVVTSNSDVTDSNDEVLTLREAIELANTSAGTDTITFDPSIFSGGLESFVRLTQGELTSTDAVIIDGTGATDVTLSGDANGDDTLQAGTNLIDVKGSTTGQLDDNSRVLVSGGDTVLQGLTITGGRTTGNNADGGGVLVEGNLVLRDSLVSGNSTAGNEAEGGGVKATGDVHVVDSRVANNHTTGSGANGGGVHADGAGVLLRSTLEDNSTTGQEGDGGGIRTEGTGGIVVVDSTVSSNTTSGRGASGGGVQARGGDLIAVNSTVVDNRAFNNDRSAGGGLNSNFDTTITNSTVTGNSTASSGGGVRSEGDLTVQNSIVVGNSANRDANLSAGGTSTVTSSLTSGAAEDVFENTAPQAGDETVQAGALANNGGPTQTVALKVDPANPAIDAGDGTVGIG